MKKSLPEKENDTGFDYSCCQMHCTLYLKGLFGKSKVNFYVSNNKLIWSQDAYDKHPKRILELSWKDMIKWKVQRSESDVTYTGMLVIVRKPIKERLNASAKKEEFEFTGESMVILQIKDVLRRYVFQNRIQDEFLLQAQIGKGNYARVFSARHRTSGRKIAVKCFEKEKLRIQDNGYDALLKEIDVMQLVGKHANLIELVGCYEGDNTYYIAMSILEGTSLYTQIKRRREKMYSMSDVRRFMGQILAGIAHYTAVGIMHRDIKPENIMFEGAGNSLERLVIVDFGLAEFESAKKFLFNKCGTPGYVAPEVANFKDDGTGNNLYNSKCDVFSAGVILHLLLTGKTVFNGKKFEEVLLLNKKCAIDFSLPIYKEINQQAFSLLKLMLEKDPIQRISAQDSLVHSFFTEPLKENSSAITTTTPIKQSSNSQTNQQEQPLEDCQNNPVKQQQPRTNRLSSLDLKALPNSESPSTNTTAKKLSRPQTPTRPIGSDEGTMTLDSSKRKGSLLMLKLACDTQQQQHQQQQPHSHSSKHDQGQMNSAHSLSSPSSGVITSFIHNKQPMFNQNIFKQHEQNLMAMSGSSISNQDSMLISGFSMAKSSSDNQNLVPSGSLNLNNQQLLLPIDMVASIEVKKPGNGSVSLKQVCEEEEDIETPNIKKSLFNNAEALLTQQIFKFNIQQGIGITGIQEVMNKEQLQQNQTNSGQNSNKEFAQLNLQNNNNIHENNNENALANEQDEQNYELENSIEIEVEDILESSPKSE